MPRAGKPRAPRAGISRYEVSYDNDAAARPIAMDARSLTLPSVAIISVVLSSMGLTYFLAQERARLDTRIDTVVTSVENLATSISQLADGLKFGATDRYTVAHHELFCARLEIANPGLKCPTLSPEIASQPTTRMKSALESVQREVQSAKEKASSARRPNKP